MSGNKKVRHQSKRRCRDYEREETGIVRGSGINYSKVADRHVDDKRFEKHRQGSSLLSTADVAAGASAAAQPKVSSQMTAVMRIMTGKEERTISEKLADSNRPTWEQYKKDNEDKLDIAGVDQKKMDAYRKELDKHREKLLTKGKNHQNEGENKRKSKKTKKRRDSHGSVSDSSNCYSSDGGRSHKRKKHKKRSSKHSRKRSEHRCDVESDDLRKKSSKLKKKKKGKRKGGNESGSDENDRLSTFFTKRQDGHR